MSIATATSTCSSPTTWTRASTTTCSAATPRSGSASTATRSTSRRSRSVLYRNNGNGTFTDVSTEAGITQHRGNGLGVVFGDYDDDGWPDLFVANDTTPNFLYHNEGGGAFNEVGLLAGVAVASDGRPRAGMGTDFGDYDGDGRLDLFVTNHELETHTLFRNLGRRPVRGRDVRTAASASRRCPFVGFGTAVPRLRQRRRPRPGHRQRPRDEHARGTSGPAAQGSAAQAAASATTAAAGSGKSAGRRAPASRSRRSAARWPPATSTTTATSTCSSPTTAPRVDLLRNDGAPGAQRRADAPRGHREQPQTPSAPASA